MFGNIIKLVFKSFADNSGISKWTDGVKNSVGNMGQLSRAAQVLGATMGGVGGAIGRLVGALAQVGLEYQFGTIPFNVSLDWRPTFYLVPETRFSPSGVALSLRYRF